MNFKYYILNYPLAIIIVVLICCLAFIVLAHYYPNQLRSVLKNKLIDVPPTTIDFWSLSHFMLFILIGFLMPDQLWGWALFGTGWELIEDYLADDNSTQLVDCEVTPNGKRKLWCNGVKLDGYWYGKWDDVIVNILGYTVGSTLRHNTVDW